MAKTPTIARPPRLVAPATPDEFVLAGQPEAPSAAPKAPTKRLTIDIDAGLHRRFKASAAAGDRDMREVLTNMIEDYVAGGR